MIDYSSLILEIRNNLKLYENSVIKRDYDEAHNHALNMFAEARLLTQITKDMQSA